jgi:hypothetical protein
MLRVELLSLFTLVSVALGSTTVVFAQEPEPTTRQAVIERQQAEKVKTLQPMLPKKGERAMAKFDDILVNFGGRRWHPFFKNAYPGGGFPFGIGYLFPLSSYNRLDLRGSYTIPGYKRAEVEFVAPRLFHRRAELSITGGWREATQVGFYGIGNGTSKDDRVDYGFELPAASALFTLRPTRRYLTLGGGVEWSQWKMQSATGTLPSIETVYNPQDLPGVGADVRYLHTQATVGFDWRIAPEYARRGGFYGVTLHDYADSDDQFGFRQLDYEAIQHIPFLREAWVISLHGDLRRASGKNGQEIPFFLLPWVGGGDSVRGISSFRFRDRNSLLVQAEWRIMVNRFLDTAIFYDAGKVAPRMSDFDTKDLTHSYGFGARFHTPFTTALRVELAKSTEGFAVVFSTSPVF